MVCKKMSSSEDPSHHKKTFSSAPNTVISPNIYWVLFFASFLSMILGLFSILGVIIDTTQTNQLNYLEGLLVGLLLIGGGFILLLGAIILRRWSPPPSSEELPDSF